MYSTFMYVHVQYMNCESKEGEVHMYDMLLKVVSEVDLLGAAMRSPPLVLAHYEDIQRVI